MMEFWFPCRYVITSLAGTRPSRSGSYLEVSENSILYHLIGKEGLFSSPGISRNSVGALPDMKRGILHSGTASAIT